MQMFTLQNGSVEVDLGEQQMDTTLPIDSLSPDMTLPINNSSPTTPKAEFSSLVLDCSAWSFVDSMGVKALITVSMSSTPVNYMVCYPCYSNMFIQ